MTYNKKKKSKKGKNEREEFEYYDIVRTDERRSSIIPKLVDGEEKIPFDSEEAEIFIRRCVDPMIAETIENIKWHMNDKAYYSDFVACYARMLQVFISPFSFAIYVQRFNADESAYLSLLVIEPGTFPLFEGKVYFTKGNRDKLLRYIERESFREELFLTMKDLMNKHHKELLRIQSD